MRNPSACIRLLALISMLILLGVLVSLQTSLKPSAIPFAGGKNAAPAEVAYFKFEYPPNPETFVFELTDPQKIQEARDILSGQEPSHHIMGTVIKQPAAYNPPWSYHLDPSSVTFFDNAVETCDATIQYVEDHLDEVCSSILPGCVWCPWGSQLLAEVTPPPTETPPPPSTPTTPPTPTASPPTFIYLPLVIQPFLSGGSPFGQFTPNFIIPGTEKCFLFPSLEWPIFQSILG